MNLPSHRHQRGFEREVNLMVHTLEDRVQVVTQSDQLSLHYRLQLEVNLRPVNTSLRDLCLTPESDMDVGRLDILGGIVQTRVIDPQ